MTKVVIKCHSDEKTGNGGSGNSRQGCDIFDGNCHNFCSLASLFPIVNQKRKSVNNFAAFERIPRKQTKKVARIYGFSLVHMAEKPRRRINPVCNLTRNEVRWLRKRMQPVAYRPAGPGEYLIFHRKAAPSAVLERGSIYGNYKKMVA